MKIGDGRKNYADSICNRLFTASLFTHAKEKASGANAGLGGRVCELQSWTKVLTHLSKTNAFYRRPSVISKNIFFVSSQPPSPLFQCCNTLRGHFYLVTTLKRGEGVEMPKLEIEKFTRLTKQVLFGERLNCFCP